MCRPVTPFMPTSSAALHQPPIPAIVEQHAEESAVLRYQRSVLVRAPHVHLRQLRRLDDRIAAHLDGLTVAGDFGAKCAEVGLARAGAGEVFAVAVGMLESKDVAGLERLIALAATLPEALRGLLSAFGWVSAPLLQGVVRTLLVARLPSSRAMGLGACRLHRVHPGGTLSSALSDADATLRIEAMRTAAALGRVDQLDGVLAGLGDASPEIARWTALAACLLGDRASALRHLETLMLAEGREDQAVALLVMLASRWDRAAELLRHVSQQSTQPQRRVIRACGWLGDARLVPWLIELMSIDPLARLAGESFAMITGADLDVLGLVRQAPEGVDHGPTGNPDDEDVAMDEDDGLPWPDAGHVSRWWVERSASFPIGQRCFMGAAVTPAHAEQVLREGTQRQRAVAAVQRCILQPGTPLFPTAAPAWRQQRLLSASGVR